ncbi:hypothetical protein [Pleurochrysis sp. endemic virus 2]|nr:hypothetical protein [Pleurochrysis sp. endemic virus 2]
MCIPVARHRAQLLCECSARRLRQVEVAVGLAERIVGVGVARAEGHLHVARRHLAQVGALVAEVLEQRRRLVEVLDGAKAGHLVLLFDLALHLHPVRRRADEELVHERVLVEGGARDGAEPVPAVLHVVVEATDVVEEVVLAVVRVGGLDDDALVVANVVRAVGGRDDVVPLRLPEEEALLQAERRRVELLLLERHGAVGLVHEVVARDRPRVARRVVEVRRALEDPRRVADRGAQLVHGDVDAEDGVDHSVARVQAQGDVVHALQRDVAGLACRAQLVPEDGLVHVAGGVGVARRRLVATQLLDGDDKLVQDARVVVELVREADDGAHGPLERRNLLIDGRLEGVVEQEQVVEQDAPVVARAVAGHADDGVHERRAVADGLGVKLAVPQESREVRRQRRDELAHALEVVVEGGAQLDVLVQRHELDHHHPRKVRLVLLVKDGVRLCSTHNRTTRNTHTHAHTHTWGAVLGTDQRRPTRPRWMRCANGLAKPKGLTGSERSTSCAS